MNVPAELVDLVEWLIANVEAQTHPNWRIVLNANGSEIKTELHTYGSETDARGDTVQVQKTLRGRVRIGRAGDKRLVLR